MISGHKDDANWVARKMEWQEDKTFRNPLLQNEGHLHHLKKIMGKDAPNMTSMVIFPYADITLVKDLVFDDNTAKTAILSSFSKTRYRLNEVKRFKNELDQIQARYGISKQAHVKSIIKKTGERP